MSIKGRIYIAGPGVFMPNAVEIGKDCKKICRKYGFLGLFPLDNKATDSKAIFLGNKSYIDQSDIVVADINSFRGDTMDDGTAWEIGYAYATKKPVFCYLSDARSLIEKIGREDSEGYAVEDFGKPINLMIAEAATKIVCGSFEDCIREVAERYD